MPSNVRMRDFERRRILEYVCLTGLNSPLNWVAQTYTDAKRVSNRSRVYSLNNGSTTWNAQGQKLTTTYQTVLGSSINYKPPPNTNYIIYRFQYAIAPQVVTAGTILNAADNASAAHFKFQINGVDVGSAYYTSRANRLNHKRETFEWVIQNIQNGDQPNITEVSLYGTQLYWGEEGLGNDVYKNLQLVARGRVGTSGSQDLGSLHTAAYWSGAQQNIPILPVLSIISVGGHVRTSYF